MTEPYEPPSETPQPPQYGAPQYGAPQYGAPQYGSEYAVPPAQTYGAPMYGGPPTGMPGLANYGKRAGAAMIDYIGPGIVADIIGRTSIGLRLVLDLLVLAWAVYNAYLAGTTGQSTGKRLVGSRLVNEVTGQNVGAGTAIGRYFLHILDSLACLIGWLWPLWDSKNQTFADKLVHTVVIDA